MVLAVERSVGILPVLLVAGLVTAASNLAVLLRRCRDRSRRNRAVLGSRRSRTCVSTPRRDRGGERGVYPS